MFQRDPKTAQIGKEILPFEMGYLPEFFQKKAEVELNDTLENREKGLKVLKEFIKNDKYMNGICFNDDFLLQYLRYRKFNEKKAFTQLKAFVNLREKDNAMFAGYGFEKIPIYTRNNIITFLPYRCQDGCVIVLVKTGNWIPEEFPDEELKRMTTVYFAHSVTDIMTQVNGFKVIFDFDCNPVYHLRHVTPSNIQLIYHGSMDCFAGRFKAFHILNTSLTWKAAWAIVKIFIKPKLKRRFHFHDTPETLLDYFPATVLPVEYGGVLKDYNRTDWLKDVLSPENLTAIFGGIKTDF